MSWLLGATLIAQAALFVYSAISWLAPGHRIWPPPPHGGWQLYTTWFLSWVSLSGVFLLALFDDNTFGWPLWVRLGAGVPLVALGVVGLAWASGELSLQSTLGLPGRLVRSGPYRWSRNPQYVAACLYLASLVVLSGSRLAAIGCLAVALWFVATPFVEEPWLAERHGEDYAAYREEVPRFLAPRGPRAR
jgi:protein-S-isoprenylcysteine O-methyltransferase Ste14